jgi:hypothetical protein
MTRVSSRVLVTFAAGCVLAVAAPGHAVAKSGAAYPYTLVDPGTFGGPSSFVDLPGVPITRDGTVLGTADTATSDPDFPSDPFHDGYVQHPFIWRAGRLTDLGALPPAAADNSEIYGRNSHGLGVGVSENGRVDPLADFPAQEATLYVHGRVVAESRTFVWRDGVVRDIGTLGGSDAVPSVQNERGQIAGSSFTTFTANPSTWIPTLDPFLWDHGHMRDLGSLGGTMGGANWLNDNGSGDQRVFVLIRNPSVPLPSMSTAAARLTTPPVHESLPDSIRERVAARMPELLLGPR